MNPLRWVSAPLDQLVAAEPVDSAYISYKKEKHLLIGKNEKNKSKSITEEEF